MTKSQANKLGKLIREELKHSETPSNTLLNNLQIYRTSFQNDVSEVFENISNIAKSIRKDSIICFRIKGIESILSKIKRKPALDLDAMEDIAGCRILVHHSSAIKKLIDTLTSTFKVKHANDCLKKNKGVDAGGYFIYIESPVNTDKIIEIQIKTVQNHKWVSLIEIIDTVFNTNIKEEQKQPDFENFLSLLADKPHLSISQKEQLIEIDSKYEIYKKLNDVFIKNYMKLRNDWLSVNPHENPYFILEVDPNKTSHIKSYQNYELAEKAYFNMFKEHIDSRVVLTHIEKPNFKKLSVAYKSSLLIKHDYMNDWDTITSDILEYYVEKDDNTKITFYKDYIQKNLSFQINLLNSEFKVLNKNKIDYSEYEEWFYDLEEKLLEIQKIVPQERPEIKEDKKRNFWSKMFGE
ncbi:RelA/SpoT domain-containing protein [Tenacibaculum sp. MAR_2009_124]|uniref:RelA/SpoT domain-containing protein n=1 Tax=Tenacibaculum sp. MAR_2009_124 TaxID=1250059 RepID=UPI0015A407B4|nr:RelA/SpoT domain-containing protein [Tenacibaculum sp. MAR_2009_124]